MDSEISALKIESLAREEMNRVKRVRIIEKYKNIKRWIRVIKRNNRKGEKNVETKKLVRIGRDKRQRIGRANRNRRNHIHENGADAECKKGSSIKLPVPEPARDREESHRNGDDERNGQRNY